MQTVLVIGGYGALGRTLIPELKKNAQVVVPTKHECNILDFKTLSEFIKKTNPDTILHIAGFVDTLGCETNLSKALDVNVIGTINIVKSCLEIKCKLVYISSEYIFSGLKGNYTIEDRLDPINVYGKTKAASEYIVSTYSDNRIIRAPFIKTIHNKALIDQYSSRFFLEDLVEPLVQAILYEDKKLTHIVNKRMSIYELYKSKGLNPTPISRADISSIIPKDTSLI
jgi:dTDP-4-dehydrorhamnose reductase